MEKIICVDQRESDFMCILLMCMLDKERIRSFRKVKKSDGYKVWIYDKITYEEIDNYKRMYREEIENIKEKIKS